MGFEIQNSPHPLLTALISNPQNITSFLSTLGNALQNNCDSLITPIFSDEYLEQQPQTINLDNCFILSDDSLKKFQLNIITPLINDCIWSKSHEMRVKLLHIIIGYSSYLNLRYFAINFNLENCQAILQTLRDPQIAKQLKKCVPNLSLLIETSGDNDQKGEKDDKIWKKYIQFRQILEQVKFPLYIQVGIQIKPNAPINRIINRWKSQKITYIILSKNCFTQNAKGFIILPAKHERMVIQLLVLKGLLTLKVDLYKQKQQKEQRHHNLQDFYKYVLYVFRKFAQNKLRSEKEAINLQDFLQNPLQPYADNLQSATYEVFQFDQQKYDQYQGAIQEALETFPKNKRIVIYYIGTGRGGLLFNVFSAAKKAQRKVFVYAIEKNLYPIQTIKKRLKQNQWQNNVKIVHTDIRNYEMPEKPDIFLSELLGGFGDNELSPECLYWAQKNIQPDTICIPTDYTSFIRPVSYQYVHRKIELASRQIYYTVNYGNYYTNFGSQQVWKFTHPLRKPIKQQKIEENESNKEKVEECPFNRYSRTTFTSKQDMIINGFAGYFTCGLYKHCELSILPEKPTFGMYSWYPLFFCFQNAEFLAKGQEIAIELWRKYTEKKVWYEWKYKIGNKESIVHNKDGAFVAIQI